MSTRRNAIAAVAIAGAVLTVGVIEKQRIDCGWRQPSGVVVQPLPDIPFLQRDAVGDECLPTPCLPDDGGVLPCVRRPTPIEVQEIRKPEVMP